MLERFTEYFNRIEMPGPIVARAESVCNLFREVIQVPISDTFVTDGYQQPEGVRRYNNLWLVAGPNVFEAKSFPVQTNIDIIRLVTVKRIEWTAIELNDFRGPSTIRSQLDAKISFEIPMGGQLTAVHNNCIQLFDFVCRTFVPLVRGHERT